MSKKRETHNREVKADLPRYEKPNPIGQGQHIPDIEAINWWGEKVREIARELKNEGYEVKADLPRYEKPNPIGQGQHIPDIEATNWWGEKVIVEVDTPGTEDPNQLSAFRRSAAQQNAEFRHKIVKPEERRSKSIMSG